MNKKKLLAMLISLCLVAALGVGATFALFTSKTNELTNTFTVGGGITAHLEEVVGKDDTGKIIVKGVNTVGVGKDDGEFYENIQPFAELTKEPYMVIEKESSNCYALVKVTGIDALEKLNNGDSFEVGAFNSNWKKIANADKGVADDKKDGIYLCYDDTVIPCVPKKFNTIKEDNQHTDKLFEKVTLKNMDTDQLKDLKGLLEPEAGKEIPKIIIVGCAIQADNAQAVADSENSGDLVKQLLTEAVFN